jgi:hypothetical protein
MNLTYWRVPAISVAGTLLLLAAWAFGLPSGNCDRTAVVDALSNAEGTVPTQPVYIESVRSVGGTEIPSLLLYHPFNWGRRFNESMLNRPGPLGMTGQLDGKTGAELLSINCDLQGLKNYETCAELKLHYEIWWPPGVNINNWNAVNYGIAVIDIYCVADDHSGVCLSLFQSLSSDLPDIYIRMQ